MSTALLELVAKLDLANQLFGLFVGGALAVWRSGWKTLLQRRPFRRFFADLADNTKTLSVFAREMVSADGKYYSQLPDGSVAEWQNFPVVGLVDVEAATDALNVLAQAGRTSNIAWRRVTSDSGIWNEPMVCVGGSFKVDQILSLCKPAFLDYSPPDTFMIRGGPTFKADHAYDYGLVARVRHPETEVSCFVLAGFGMAGTAAAGYFLRSRARDLSLLYGSYSFAVVLRVGWHDGSSSATPVWMSADTMAALPMLHPFVWRRYRLHFREGVV